MPSRSTNRSRPGVRASAAGKRTALGYVPPILVGLVVIALVVVLPLWVSTHLVEPRYGIPGESRLHYVAWLALDVLLKALPWTLGPIIWWAVVQGERSAEEDLRARGVVAPATVTWIRDTEALEGGFPKLEVFVHVTPDRGEPFDTTVKAAALPAASEPLHAGMDVRVRYDPENPTANARLEE